MSIILSIAIQNNVIVQAANKPYMESLDVKWNLKENMWTIIRSNWAGNVWIKSRAMIRNISLKDANKKGYKKLTCTIHYERPMLTKTQVKRILHSKKDKKYIHFMHLN